MATYSESYETQFPKQSVAEEIANSVTHGLGLALCVAGGMVILSLALDRVEPDQFVGLILYVAALISVYASSTLSHAIQQPAWKHRWRIIDQAVIYLLIAGTYTPFILTYVPAGYKWLLFGAVWFFAVAGFLSKSLLKHRVEVVAVTNYILLGWLPAAAMLSYMPFVCVVWMALGGVLYTFGALFLSLDQRVAFFHATWHLFVVGASIAHFYAIVHFTII